MPIVIDGSNNSIYSTTSSNVVFQSNVVFANTVSFTSNTTFTTPATFNANTTFTTPATFNANVTFTGSITGITSGWASANVRYFTSTGSGTYTAPPGLKAVYLKMQGAGGSGGAANRSGAARASGGGGGAYIEGYLTASQIGSSQTYVVGAGGAGVSAPAGCTVANGNAGSNTGFGTIFVAAAGGAGQAQVFLPTGPVSGTYGGLVTSLYSGNYYGNAGGSTCTAPNNSTTPGGSAGNPGMFSTGNSPSVALPYGAGSPGARSCSGPAATSLSGAPGYIYMIEYY